MGEKNIFALDIGTRKIVGLVMTKDDNGYKIVAAENREHSTRAMVDGQIHDIEAVAQTIKQIKQRLEQDLGVKLEKVAVAAAGRALKTCRGTAARERSMLAEITSDEVRALEAEAVQQAQHSLAQKGADAQDHSAYFCVGYSVIKYLLEDQEIGSLIGQRGHSLTVEVIATFLPRVVVDSLYSSLQRVGLNLYSLTLEPIAALAVAIPPGMRLLNLALVDIGAGTSDIAIVKGGNIFGYAMVPMGGDELTECIAEQYLLDFNKAETIKRQINSAEIISFSDILSNQMEIPSNQMKKALKPLVKEITAAIAQHILELNRKSPDAVMCVGGGSLTPGITSELADALGMARTRVGIKTRETLESISGEYDFLKGPLGVTPLGIAFNSFDHSPLPLMKVQVNGHEVALWNAGEANVMQALISSGIALTNIYGRPGMGKTITINGKVIIFKGEIGTPPVIELNGTSASLETKIQEGDDISFTKGRDGLDAVITPSEIYAYAGSPGSVYVNAKEIELVPAVKVNGHNLDAELNIPDRAQIQVQDTNLLSDILIRAGVAPYRLQETVYSYYLGPKEEQLKWVPVRVLVDGSPAALQQPVSAGARLEYELGPDRPRIKDIINRSHLNIHVTVNDAPVSLEVNSYSILMNGQPVGEDETIRAGARFDISGEKSECILSDIFKVFNFNPNGGTGRLVLEVDGQSAGYTTPIQDGSVIKIYWE